MVDPILWYLAAGIIFLVYSLSNEPEDLATIVAGVVVVIFWPFVMLATLALALRKWRR